MSVEQEAMFVISTPPMPVYDIVEEWVRPLQDFLILALGRPVRLTKLLLKWKGVGKRDDLAEATFDAVQAAPGPAPSWSALMSYSAPTLGQLAMRPVDLAPSVEQLDNRLAFPVQDAVQWVAARPPVVQPSGAAGVPAVIAGVVQPEQRARPADRPAVIARVVDQVEQAGLDAGVHSRRDPAGAQSQDGALARRLYRRIEAATPHAQPQTRT